MLSFTSHGACLGVVVELPPGSSPELPARLVDLLPVGSRIEDLEQLDALFRIQLEPPGGATGSARAGEGESGERYVLEFEGEHLAKSPQLEEILDCLAASFHFQVARHARSVLFVHAGVVSWEGRALVIPGRSHSGKSTLVAALVEQGAKYCSDEYALFDDAGRVHAYPRPLSLRAPGREGHWLPPLQVAGPVQTDPMELGWILWTAYSPGAVFQPKARRGARGLMHLLDNAVLVREKPRTVVDALARAADGALLLEGSRGEAHSAAAWLLDHLDPAAEDAQSDEAGATASPESVGLP